LCIHGKETLCQENADGKEEKFPAAKSGPTSKHKIREEKLQKELRIRERKKLFSCNQKLAAADHVKLKIKIETKLLKQTKGKEKRNRNHATQKEEGKNGKKRVFAADRGRKSMGKNGRQKTKVGNKPTDNVYA
jgi:hypothetical protein